MNIDHTHFAEPHAIWRRILNSRAVIVAFCAAATFAVFLFRRPDQFANPYIWVEDGTTIMKAYLDHGWLTFFYPAAGYIILPTKLIHALSLLISFRWYPEVSYWLTYLFTASVISTIALAPTSLRYPTWCAIAVLIIPENSEVFAVSEYTLWWGALLLFVPLLWREGEERILPRILIIVFGGFSSPLIVFLAPLYFLRALLTRERTDKILFAIAASVGAVQLTAVYVSQQLPHSVMVHFNLALTLAKFFGWFSYWQPNPAHITAVTWIGVFSFVVVVVLSVFNMRNQRMSALLLFLALPLTIFASVARVPIEAMDPHYTAPRYFFYPFILISWIFIQSIDIRHLVKSSVAAAFLLAAFLNFCFFSTDHHSYMDWRMQIDSCLNHPSFMFKIHFQGRQEQMWGQEWTNSQCKWLVTSSLFDNKI